MATFNTDVEISEDELIDYVVNNYAPEDIYIKDVLEEWAEGNGYVLEEIYI